jgi:hypothetical protein
MASQICGICILVLIVAAAFACGPATAVTLYDAALGTKPSAQGWTSLRLPFEPLPTETVTGGAYRLDTTAAGLSLFGHGLAAAPALDTSAGFSLSFTLELESESHSSNNRAGYTMIVTGADVTKAIEFGFWTGNVWAYAYDDLQADKFVRGADVAFDTTAALRTYTLEVQNQQYALASGGTPLLSGPLVDYSSWGAPYNVANFIYFGDNTSRGSSISLLADVVLTPVPEPAPAVLLAAGLAMLAWRVRARLS